MLKLHNRLPIVILSLINLGLFDVAFAKSIRNFEYPHDPHSLLVRFKPTFSKVGQIDLIKKLGGTISHPFKSSATSVARFKNPNDIYEIAKQLSQSPAVDFIEANTILNADLIPNDPSFPDLYGLHNTGQNSGTKGADIGAVDAWDISTGSKKVVVAIIDTGINAKHPDIVPNLWHNPGESGLDENGMDKQNNNVDDDRNGFVDDWHGWNFVGKSNDPKDDNGYNHGSHCAGVIGASGNDGFGVVGVNWTVSLVGIKFLDAAGTGSLENAVKSVEYATSLRVDIMSNSWGGGGYSQVMFDAIEGAKKQGILFVAAAGNQSLNTDQIAHYPSAYKNDNILAVAATDNKDLLAPFSNFGMKSVDLAAPGVDILSLANKSEFRKLSGTSMATPHVSGAAALIKAVYPDISYPEIIRRLMSGVDRKENLSGFTQTSGRVNIANSLENDSVPPNIAKNITLAKKDRASVTLTWTLAGDDGDMGTASSYELRYAKKPIQTEEDWSAAEQSSQHVSIQYFATPIEAFIDDLVFNYSGYLAIKAYDNVGNQSPISKSIPFSVTKVHMVYENQAETMDDITATGKWGIEKIGDGLAFSDSPGQWYEDDWDSSITFPVISVPKANLTLAYYTKSDLEKGYDFGYAEISVDGGSNWKQLDLITGTKDWHRRLVELSDPIAGTQSFQIRFRLKTDYAISGDGWWINAVQIISEDSL